MYGWSFAARTSEELSRLLRALGKHRYLQQVDLRLHWAVDLALAELEPAVFGARAAEFAALQERRPELERGSRDPDLWASASVDEVVTVVTRFWDPGPDGGEARRQLRAHLRNADIPEVEHCPFVCDADETPHPELLLLDWVLLAVDELDTQRHAGALRAMETAQEEVSASEAQYMETMALSEAELCGARGGVIPADFMLWADGAYSYCDYVLRGVARSAKLVDPPSGYRDVDSG